MLRSLDIVIFKVLYKTLFVLRLILSLYISLTLTRLSQFLKPQ